VPGRYMYTCFERRRGWLAGCLVCVRKEVYFLFILISFFFLVHPLPTLFT
jgi:hypothetical protein